MPHYFVHNQWNTGAYRSWRAMIRRCTDPAHAEYARYGGRGIAVCDRWLDVSNFVADMGDRPEGMTLDRIDCDIGYEPTNCRWLTMKEQASNRRSSHRINVRGEMMSLAAAAERFGIKHDTLYTRIVKQGWSVEEAMRQPSKTHCKRGHLFERNGTQATRCKVCISLSHERRSA